MNYLRKRMWLMHTKEYIIQSKTRLEAGYVNNPKDRGGETNHGITYALANEPKNLAILKSRFNWDGKMVNLTKEMAYYLYDNEFWVKLYLDRIFQHYPLVADKIFEMGINTGRGKVATSLQRILNAANRNERDFKDLKVDGSIGPATYEALKGFVRKRGNRGELQLLMGLTSCQGYHYLEITENRPDNEEFFVGWLERIVEQQINYKYKFK